MRKRVDDEEDFLDLMWVLAAVGIALGAAVVGLLQP